ncbi:UPF0758 domain-containing protein [Neisseria sicca]|uniref:UPF0758 domain-containing protein n=1 Tax=Neisseria sicca TaxID=490 RepID=UPI0034D97F12
MSMKEWREGEGGGEKLLGGGGGGLRDGELLGILVGVGRGGMRGVDLGGYVLNELGRLGKVMSVEGKRVSG